MDNPKYNNFWLVMGISVYSNKITQHFLEFVAVQVKYFIHLFWQKKKKIFFLKKDLSSRF